MSKKSRKNKKNQPVPVIHPPSKHAALIDAVCKRDRQFFEEHPEESHYVRPYVPGELDLDAIARLGESPPSQDSWMLVSRLAPSVRMRHPVLPLPDLPRGSRLLVFQPWTKESVTAWVEPWPTHQD
jgi:hypothetical protein